MKSKEGYQQIVFQGNKYILVLGAITTPNDYKHGYPSYAHLEDNGRIMRYGNQIGTKKDIKFTKKFIDVEPNYMEAISNMFGGSGWF
jgi:hypothetical protein